MQDKEQEETELSAALVMRPWGEGSVTRGEPGHVQRQREGSVQEKGRTRGIWSMTDHGLQRYSRWSWVLGGTGDGIRTGGEESLLGIRVRGTRDGWQS